LALSAIISIDVAGGRNIVDGFPRVVGGGEAVPSDEVEGLIVAGGFGGEDFVDAVKAAHGASESRKWKVVQATVMGCNTSKKLENKNKSLHFGAL
jgi:hypothetical protein